MDADIDFEENEHYPFKTSEEIPDTIREPSPTIENVVCTAKVGVQLNLAHLCLKLRKYGAEYNPKRFAAVIVHLAREPTQPKTTALIFGPGKIVCTGTKCPYSGLLAMRTFVSMIQEAGYHAAVMTDFTIQNVVGTYRTGLKIQLNVIAHQLPGASYEPEQFPGVIYKCTETFTVFLIFVSGKIVIAGAKTPDQIRTSAVYIAPFCYSSRYIKGSNSVKRIRENIFRPPALANQIFPVAHEVSLLKRQRTQ